MWFVMFMLLLSNFKEKTILLCFIACCFVEGFSFYFDYQAKIKNKDTLDILAKTNNELLEKFAYPLQNLSGFDIDGDDNGPQ